MSEHVGYVVQINELNPHSNADRLQIATIFGQSVIVGLDAKVGDLGVFFPVDLQLSVEYCAQNNLVRKKDENGNNVGGYLDPDKRNIRAMKLRGEKSEGLFMPLESLAYTGETKFEVGNKIEILNGHEICRKYIPRGSHSSGGNKREGNRTRKRSVPIAPLFAEHADTEQLVYNLDAFRPGDIIELTLKMHGTSGRTGYLPKFVGYKSKFHLFERLANMPLSPNKNIRKFQEQAINHCTPIYDWGYVTGTRRVVLNDFEDGGFYGSNAFREKHAKFFEGKLHKGETVYYEIVGFTTDGAPIMAQVSNSKISDKEFSKMYGKTTTFSYGCDPKGQKMMYGDDEHGQFALPVEVPQSDMYVYRMTMTNEDGDVVEYTPDYMRYRCEQMGAKCVPLLSKAYIYDENLIDKMKVVELQGKHESWFCYPAENETIGDCVKHLCEEYYDGPDPVGKTHVREGVVVRIVNRPKFTAYKHKNFSFKVLEGIAKDLAAEPDMEEAQDLIEEEA